jgi:hypothetical protein
MKKALWTFLAAALLLGVVFFLKGRTEKAAVSARYAFDTGAAARVTRLHVEYLGDRITLLRDKGAWLTAGDSFPADTARLRRVIAHLLAMQVREPVSRDTTGSPNLVEYGLDSASVRRVEFTLGEGAHSKTHRVLLGKTSGIDFGSSYWKFADKAGVYRTPGSFVYEISSRSQDWKDTNLFVAFRAGDIRSLRVEWNTDTGTTHHYRIERIEPIDRKASAEDSAQSTGFRLREPVDAPAGRSASIALFRYATQFKVDEFVPGIDVQKPRAALDRPVMTIRILLKDGSERVVVAGGMVDGLYRYVRHPWHRDPVRVFSWRFDYFDKTLEELLEKK